MDVAQRSVCLFLQQEVAKMTTWQVKTSTVTFPSGAETASGFLAEPEGAGPFPAMVVLQEWWGINDQIKDVTKQIARQGYVALAVDLYQGKVAQDPGEANGLARALPQDRALRDMQGAISFLKDRPNARGDKIGSIGWCMGGTYSLLLALNSRELAACVVYYGTLVTDSERLKGIACPVLGIFGEEDSVVPLASVKAFERAMKELNKDIAVHIYPGAGHAFANPTRTDVYRREAAEDAWTKTLAFWQRYLNIEG